MELHGVGLFRSEKDLWQYICDDKVSTYSCNFCLQVIASATEYQNEYQNARRRRFFWKIGSSCIGIASQFKLMSIKMPAAGDFFWKIGSFLVTFPTILEGSAGRPLPPPSGYGPGARPANSRGLGPQPPAGPRGWTPVGGQGAKPQKILEKMSLFWGPGSDFSNEIGCIYWIKIFLKSHQEKSILLS